jgi:hypothetical protein
VVGRIRRDGNHSPQKNISTQDSNGNEENGYPVPDPNKTMINNSKEPSDAHKNTLKESCKKKLKISLRRYSTWLTKIYKVH